MSLQAIHDQIIDSRVINEIWPLYNEINHHDQDPNQQRYYKELFENNANQDEEPSELDPQISLNNIEILTEYRQVRVEFHGFKSSYYWKDSLISFVIKYNGYPEHPPIVQFDKGIRHQNIVQNKGQYCLPELGQKFWKRSTRMVDIINKVINTFHQLPPQSDYPVDLSVISLYNENQQLYFEMASEIKKHLILLLAALKDDKTDYYKRKVNTAHPPTQQENK